MSNLGGKCRGCWKPQRLGFDVEADLQRPQGDWPVTGASAADNFPARFERAVEDALHWAQRLNELELLAFGAFAIDQAPSIRLAFRDSVAVRLDRGGKPFLLGRHSDDAVGSDLRHSASRRLGLEIGDEFVEIDVVANVKANVHHSREGGAHVAEGLGEDGAAARGLLGVAVLQQLDHDIVELDEAHIELAVRRL